MSAGVVNDQGITSLMKAQTQTSIRLQRYVLYMTKHIWKKEIYIKFMMMVSKPSKENTNHETAVRSYAPLAMIHINPEKTIGIKFRTIPHRDTV